MRKKPENKVRDTLGLRNEDKVPELQQNSVIMNEIDKDIYHDMVDTYDAMADNLNKGMKEYAPFTNLSEDIYNSLFKGKPRLNEAEDMSSFNRFNHSIMETMMETEDYKNLHNATQYDMLSSSLATEVMQSSALSEIEVCKEELRKQKKGEEHDGDKAAAGNMIDKLNQQGKVQDKIDDLMGGRSEDQLTAAEVRKLAKLQAELQDIQDEIEIDIQGQQAFDDSVGKTLKDKMKQALIDVAEIQEAVDAWGLAPGGTVGRISVGQRKAAIERIRRSPRLKNLTDTIGRMKAIAQQKKKRKMPDGYSIDNVETGNKLESILPSEMMKLAHPATKKDFMNRYQSGQLLQYKKSEIRQIGRGPVVVCHDKSGSMNGERDDWATALALAMLEVAQKEKRNYAYIPYESQVMKNRVKNIIPGELDPDDILEIAECPVTGGTNFMAPLDEARNCLMSDKYKKGDIVFITDGECGVDDRWLARFMNDKAEKQFYVNTILINAGGGHVSTGTISKFSDNITTISDLANFDNPDVANIFRMVEDEKKNDATAQPDANQAP